MSSHPSPLDQILRTQGPDMSNTLTQSSTQGLTFTHQDTEFSIITPDGQHFGHIGYDLTRHQWAYVPYSQYPAITAGTYDECMAAATADYNAQHEPTFIPATVQAIASKPTPAYLQSGSWRASGAGFVTAVTVATTDGLADTYTVSVPALVARKLRRGSAVELFRLNSGKLAIRWSRKPVRRSVGRRGSHG